MSYGRTEQPIAPISDPYKYVTGALRSSPDWPGPQVGKPIRNGNDAAERPSCLNKLPAVDAFIDCCSIK